MPLYNPTTESQIALSDVTTDDVTTSKHGFAPKAPNDTTKFLRGDASWSVLVKENITSTGAVASEPGSPASGDLYFPNNGISEERYSGSAWVQWGPIWPLTDPTLQTWAWINQSTATVSSTNGGILLVAAGAAAYSLNIRKKAAPSTPYSVTAMFLPRILYGASAQTSYGLCWRESGSGKLTTFWVDNRGVQNNLYTQTMNSPTSANTVVANVQNLTNLPRFMRLRDDGSTRYCEVSEDGYDFFTTYSVTRTTFITPDEIGFFVDGASASVISACRLIHWKEA